jgi:hypothetical protein
MRDTRRLPTRVTVICDSQTSNGINSNKTDQKIQSF